MNKEVKTYEICWLPTGSLFPTMVVKTFASDELFSARVIAGDWAYTQADKHPYTIKELSK